MAESSIKISLELVDKAAQKALSDFTAKADLADRALGKMAGSGSSAFSQISVGIGKSIGAFDIFTGNLAANVAIKAFESLKNISGAAFEELTIGAIKSAEQVKATNAQFTALANNSGVAADALRSAFVGAGDGLIDDTDLIKSANKALIELGSFAGNLPDLLTIARKASVVFGGEVTANFESITQAIASGNTRALKQIGIFVDSSDAADKYAASLGVTAKELSDTGRQQAILTEVLSKGNKAFATVDESNLSTTNSLTRLKVSFKDLGEAAEVFYERVFGPAVRSAIQSAATALSDFSKAFIIAFGNDQEKAKIRVEQTNAKMQSLQKTLEEQSAFLEKNRAWLTQSGQLAQVEAGIVRLNTQISTLAGTQAYADAQSTASKAALTQKTLERTQAIKAEADEETQASNKFAEGLLTKSESVQAYYDLQLQLLQSQRESELITEQDFAARKQQIVIDQFLAENALLEESKLKGEEYFAARDQLANQFAASQAKRDADFLKREKVQQEQSIRSQQSFSQAKVNILSATANLASAIAGDESKFVFALQKAAALAQAFVATQTAATNALMVPPSPNFALAGLAKVAGGINMAAIAATTIKGFEDGGVVPGNSFTGDNVPARVNSGEMILNRDQQSRLFSMANSGGSVGTEAKLDTLIGLIAGKDDRVIVNIGGKAVVDVLRSELASGRTFV